MSDECIAATLEEVCQISENALNGLLSKWNSMYVMNGDIKVQRLHQFTAHLKDFYNDMLVGEEEKKKNFLREVDRKVKECKALEEALNVTINYDVVDTTMNPLTVIIKDLDSTLKRFEKLKEERMTTFSQLRATESNLCKRMGLSELQINNTIPSQDDIERLKHHILVYEEEMIKRQEQYMMYRKNITDIIHRLERSNLLDIEKTIMDPELPDSLTSEDLDRIKEMEESYKQEYNAAIAKVEYLYDDLTRLWKRLDIPETYQLNFKDKHCGVGRKTMDRIEEEIGRCKKLRLELIVPLIEKTKMQILEVCEKLCYSKEEYPDNIMDSNHSEDLLSYLELELGRLEIIYNENSEILEAAKKQRSLCERKRDLEAAAQDKTRLFNNRGGQLLREEKERKTIELNLPKLNKKLEEMLVKYEERSGTPFLYYGENLLLLIRDQIEQAAIHKKHEQKITDSASKRKMKCVLTPKSENVKRLKFGGSTTSLASSTKNSNKSTDGHCRLALFKDQDTSVASTYSLFQKEIEEKKKSTTMCNTQRKPLKDVNSPVISFISSPCQDNASRFTFRPRTNQFNAAAKNAKTPTFSSLKKPSAATTPAKHTFATPKSVAKSTSRLATPKTFSSSRYCTPGTDYSRNRFFETPKCSTRSAHKTGSIIKPSKFKFDF